MKIHLLTQNILDKTQRVRFRSIVQTISILVFLNRYMDLKILFQSEFQ
jgi:hypothetical protein